MTPKLIVGFRTRPVEPDVLQALTPEFAPDRRLVDEKKKAADVAERREKFLAAAAFQPYTGTFDEIVIKDPQSRKNLRLEYAGRGPGGDKTRICVAAAQWILKRYPYAWSNDTHESKKPGVVFLGFNPRLFIKMLGLECSLPEVRKPVPARLWYTNSDHRDIAEAIMPKDCGALTLDVVLKRRRPPDAESAEKWDTALKGWTEPHKDPTADVWLITELAYQLGFLED